MTDSPLHVVVTRSLPASFPAEAFSGRAEFHLAPTHEELTSAVREADVLYSWWVPPNVPAQTERLRWVQLPSAGIDHVRDIPVWDSDVVLTSSAGIHAVPMAEHGMAMLLALVRRLPTIIRDQDAGNWNHDVGQHVGEVRGRTMGILGWGKIGNSLAHLAAAFGMRVIGTRYSVSVSKGVQRTAPAFSDPPWVEPEDLPADIVFPAVHIDEVVAESDVVVSLLPLTDQTRHVIGEKQFAAMPRGGIFINLGRGAVVDEEALVRALRSGRLAGAGLDVFDSEPLPRNSPLWHMHNVIVSPHVGGNSDRTTERTAHLFAVNLSRFLEGRPLLNVVDRARGY
jgi:phosphoglycerate dehydrogenase-like enzyme